MRMIIVAVLALVFCASRGDAQSDVRLRVSAPVIQQGTVTGQLIRLDGDTLRLTSSNIPVSSIQSVDRSRGRARRLWFNIGGIAGLAIGYGIGAATGGEDNDAGGAKMALPVVMGLAGAVTGLLLAPERWERSAGSASRSRRWRRTRADRLLLRN
jgi:hypothetical protein